MRPLDKRRGPRDGGPLGAAHAERLGSQQDSAMGGVAQRPYAVHAIRNDGRRVEFAKCASYDDAMNVVAKLVLHGLSAEVAR